MPLYFPSSSTILLLHCLLFFHSPWALTWQRCQYFCLCVCVCVLECFQLDCLLLLFATDVAVTWGYFGNPQHLPHPLSLGDAGCSGLGQTLPDGRAKLLGMGQAVRQVPQHPLKGSGMSHSHSLPSLLSHPDAGRISSLTWGT